MAWIIPSETIATVVVSSYSACFSPRVFSILIWPIDSVNYRVNSVMLFTYSKVAKLKKKKKHPSLRGPFFRTGVESFFLLFNLILVLYGSRLIVAIEKNIFFFAVIVDNFRPPVPALKTLENARTHRLYWSRPPTLFFFLSFVLAALKKNASLTLFAVHY